MDAMALIVVIGPVITFVASLRLVLFGGLHICEERLVTTNFCVDRDMHDQKLPGWLQDHTQTLTGVVYEVSENHC